VLAGVDAVPASALSSALTYGPEARALRTISGEHFTRRVISVACLVRLVALAAGVFGLAGRDVTPGVIVVILLLGLTSYAGVVRQGRLPGVVLRHPILAMADVLLVLLVVQVAGVESPLVFATFSTALLVGVLFRGQVAAVLAVALVAGYTGVWQAASVPYAELGFPVVFGTPLLYVCFLAVGVAVRRVHLEQVSALQALAESQALRSGAEERARLAREMHDSLAKTLHGIALAATALPIWVVRDPERAAAAAGRLAEDAERAAAEARSILHRMRADQPDRPLAQVLGERCAAYALEHGAVCDFTTGVVDVPHDVRYEVVSIVDEALRNAADHADASRVAVSVKARDGGVEITVSDNGCGFTPGPDGSGPRGHYGLRGMHERAAVVGGRLTVTSDRAAGTVVSLHVPRQGSS
jgi:signal transduction histidine kinase